VIRQLIGHSAAYTAANLLSRGTILVWLIILPRFLGTADYGALGLIVTVAAIVNVSFPLEVSQGLARYYATAPEQDRASWASTAWTFSLTMLCAGAVAALALAPWCARLLFKSDAYLPVFRLAVPYFVLGTSFLFLQNQFRWAFRTRDYAAVTAVFAVVTLGLSILLAASLANPLWGVLLGLTTGAAVGVGFGLARLRDMLRLSVDRAKLARMLRFSLPLVPASLSLMISTYASRFILNDLLTLKDVGLFTWASQLANIPATLLLGVQAAVTPLVMKHHDDPETPRRLARSFEAVTAAALWIAIAIGLFTPELIRVLGYSSYADAAPLVMLLGPAYVILQLYVFFPGFAVAERTSHQLWVSVAGAAATLALNYLLIARLMSVGAAAATLVSSLLFLGLWVFLSDRQYRVPVRRGRFAIFCGIIVVCSVIGQRLSGGLLVVIGVKLGLVAVLAISILVLGLVDPRQLMTQFSGRGIHGLFGSSAVRR
jgi:O-antigen/teichoic acid export membrane protein